VRGGGVSGWTTGEKRRRRTRASGRDRGQTRARGARSPLGDSSTCSARSPTRRRRIKHDGMQGSGGGLPVPRACGDEGRGSFWLGHRVRDRERRWKTPGACVRGGRHAQAVVRRVGLSRDRNSVGGSARADLEPKLGCLERGLLHICGPEEMWPRNAAAAAAAAAAWRASRAYARSPGTLPENSPPPDLKNV